MTTKQLEWESRFVRTIAGWTDHRRGDLAILRRSLMRPPGLDPAAYRVVLPLVGGADEWEWWRYFLVAGLVALNPSSHVSDDGEGPNLGAALGDLGGRVNAGAIERRFVRLLDSDRDGLPVHLRQSVRLLDSHRTRWDSACLLADLRGWTRPDRLVQRRWARSFWAPATQTSPTDNPSPAPDQEGSTT